ncbi:MAG: HXXEE domain-containing protein [Planctomycetota bacterium]
MWDRLVGNWVYGGFLASFVLLGMLPLVAPHWPLHLVLVYLMTPAYMWHQYEEHDGDRFRRYFNGMLADGREVLTRRAVFVINVPLVWGVNLGALLLAGLVHPGFGLVAVYLVVVNAIVHVVPAVRLRTYNPGLVTAVALFLPLGGLALFVFADVEAGYHMLAFAIVVALHAGIVVHALRRRR